MAIAATPRSRSPPFNVTSALGRGILTYLRSPNAIVEILQRHLGAWPRDTQRVSRTRRRRPDPSTSPRRWAEGYSPCCRARLTPIPPLQRHLGAGPRDMQGERMDKLYPGTLQRHLGAWPRDIGDGQPQREGPDVPSTSPRRLAEGYRALRLNLGTSETPSTSPRRLAEGYIIGRQVPRMDRPTLQRHLGAWPRDTMRTSGGCQPKTSLQRHLGAWPRDTAASQAVDSRRIFPPISRASPFLAFHAFRGIGHERASR